MGEQQVAVIGAGPAGVSVALSLRDRPTPQAQRTRCHRTAVPRVPDSPVAHRSTGRRSKQVARAIADELSDTEYERFVDAIRLKGERFHEAQAHPGEGRAERKIPGERDIEGR